MEIIIKQSTVRDLPATRKLQDELNKARVLLWKKSKLFHQRIKLHSPITKIPRKDIILIAESDGIIVGYVWGKIENRAGYKLSKFGYINELFVDKSFRNKGVAGQLIRKLIKSFKENGCEFIFTKTDWENEPARSLYESLGMSGVTVELWKKI